eukprot:SAG11_NODE_12108_length_721_cov_1.435691_1_plen_112_part_01
MRQRRHALELKSLPERRPLRRRLRQATSRQAPAAAVRRAEARQPGHGRFLKPRAAAAWSQHSSRVLRWIRRGYRMPWLRNKPPRPFWRRAYPTDEKQRSVLQKERDTNLKEG